MFFPWENHHTRQAENNLAMSLSCLKSSVLPSCLQDKSNNLLFVIQDMAQSGTYLVFLLTLHILMCSLENSFWFYVFDLMQSHIFFMVHLKHIFSREICLTWPGRIPLVLICFFTPLLFLTLMHIIDGLCSPCLFSLYVNSLERALSLFPPCLLNSGYAEITIT